MIVEPRTYDEKCAALEAAFSRLQEPRETKGAGIPYKEVIPSIARELILMQPVQNPTHATAKTGLKKVAAHADRTVKALDRLPEDALKALNIRPDRIRKSRIMLVALSLAAKRPGRNSSTSGYGGFSREKSRGECRGALLRSHGQTEADSARQERGPVNGPFLELLTEVFRILEVKASAASQGNAIEREWEGRGA